MHFYNVIKDLADQKSIKLFFDMDGVISSYDAGKPLDFLNKRPLTENIRKIEEISKLSNVELYILSICKKDFQIEEKNTWLDKNAPFFKKNNRIVISKEGNIGVSSADLKANYLKNLVSDSQIVVVDDDNLVLKTIMDKAPKVIVFQDSELID
jgi:hypothetical protein